MPGLFDPLTATQAKRVNSFAEPGRKLAMIVLDTEQTLLPADARAALIAALRAVNLVAIAQPHEWRAAIPASTDIRVIDDLAGEAARSAEFIQFVFHRQAESKNGAQRP